MNVNEAIQTAIKEARMTRSVNTIHVYQNGLNHFKEYLSGLGIEATDKISRVDIEHFIGFPAYMAARMARNSCQVYVAASHFLLDWLVIHRLIKPDWNELKRYQMARKASRRKQRGEKSLSRFPKAGQAERLLRASRKMTGESPGKERNHALISLLYSSGCRAIEACELRRPEVDVDNREAIVRGKGGNERRIFFDGETAQALGVYWKARGGEEGLVFKRHDPGADRNPEKPLSTATVREIVRSACANAGIEGPFTPHYFRHAFAIKMLKKTGNLALVQDLLGHSSPQTTRVYAKITSDELRKAHHEIYR